MPVDHGKDFGTLGQIKGTCVREREEGEGKEGKAVAIMFINESTLLSAHGVLGHRKVQ